MSFDFLQVLMGWAGSLGFSVLFNVRGLKLILASLGGAFSWSLYLLVEPLFPSEMFRYFLSAAFVAFYAEILARILKTPATTFLVPSIIPHDAVCPESGVGGLSVSGGVYTVSGIGPGAGHHCGHVGIRCYQCGAE